MIDTQTNPGVARAAVQRALDAKPLVLFGPIYSGSVKATMPLLEEAQVAQIMGGEAADLTQQGSAYIFRTSFGQTVSMPKIANYIRDVVKAKSVAVIWVNNDFGKGGRDDIVKELGARGIKIAADISTEAGQADFAADVIKVKGSGADAVFVYTNEEESARYLREIKKQGVTLPQIGETTLLGQKMIDLAGDAAEGVEGPCRPVDRCASAGDEGVRRQVRGKVQVQTRSQRHQGLHGRVDGQVRRRESRQARCQGYCRCSARADDHPG